MVILTVVIKCHVYMYVPKKKFFWANFFLYSFFNQRHACGYMILTGKGSSNWMCSTWDCLFAILFLIGPSNIFV